LVAIESGGLWPGGSSSQHTEENALFLRVQKTAVTQRLGQLPVLARMLTSARDFHPRDPPLYWIRLLL